jgi:hypothetical protein
MLSLPAEEPDLSVARAAVAACTHIEVRDLSEAERAVDLGATVPTSEFALDLRELERP